MATRLGGRAPKPGGPTAGPPRRFPANSREDRADALDDALRILRIGPADWRLWKRPVCFGAWIVRRLMDEEVVKPHRIDLRDKLDAVAGHAKTLSVLLDKTDVRRALRYGRPHGRPEPNDGALRATLADLRTTAENAIVTLRLRGQAGATGSWYETPSPRQLCMALALALDHEARYLGVESVWPPAPTRPFDRQDIEYLSAAFWTLAGGQEEGANKSWRGQLDRVIGPFDWSRSIEPHELRITRAQWLAREVTDRAERYRDVILTRRPAPRGDWPYFSEARRADALAVGEPGDMFWRPWRSDD